MSFIKKESNIVENELVSEVSDYIPQHPMLQWSGQAAVPKRDHLEDYKEVRPFEESEGLWSDLKNKFLK